MPIMIRDPYGSPLKITAKVSMQSTVNECINLSLTTAWNYAPNTLAVTNSVIS